MTDAGTPRQLVAQAKALLQGVLNELMTSAPNRTRLAMTTTRLIAQLGRLEQKLSVRRPGRPRGRRTDPVSQGNRLAAHYAQALRFKWCEQTGRRRASRAQMDAWLSEAIKQAERDVPEARGRLDRERIRSGSLKRIVRRRLSRRFD
jgi:multidrug resistance efflux pump